MSAEPLVVASASIEHRHPRLGGRLIRAGFGAFLGFPGLLMTIFVTADRTTDHPSVTFPGILVILSIAGFFVAPFVLLTGIVLTSVSLPRRGPGVLRADGHGLVVVRGGKEHHVSRSALEGGLVLPGTPAGKPPRVELHLRNGAALTAEVPDGMTAHRLLDRLGIDAARRRVAVLSGSSYRPLVTGCISLPIVWGLFLIPLGYLATEYPSANWPPLAFVGAVLLTMLLIVRRTRPREIVVGSDGLRIRGAFRDRWIPHSHIRTIEEKERVLFLEAGAPDEAGRRIEVATGDPSFVMAVAGRLRLAIALGSNGAGGPPVGAELDPAGKSFTEWKDKLQALLLDAGYRKAAVTYEELYSVVEDPDLPPGQRLGAAVALRIAQHPDAAVRIRVAADACADEAMKRAFEEAAEGELGERTLRRVLD